MVRKEIKVAAGLLARKQAVCTPAENDTASFSAHSRKSCQLSASTLVHLPQFHLQPKVLPMRTMRVIEFLTRDDNSRQTASKRETLTPRKQKRQKRFLSFTLAALFEKYVSEQG